MMAQPGLERALDTKWIDEMIGAGHDTKVLDFTLDAREAERATERAPTDAQISD